MAASVGRFQFHSPTTISVYAPPYSGKSTLARKILENAQSLFTTPPEFIVYCYNEWLPMLKDMKVALGTKFISHAGIPTREDMEKWSDGRHFIIVLDDLQQDVQNNKDAAEMFTVGSHHKNFTLIYMCHNIFGRGKFSRLINLNSHYMILFRNNRDTQQVQTLGRQIFGANIKYFMDAYSKATSKEWGYLVVNIHPKTRDHDPYKLLTGIIPGEQTVVYGKN